MILHINDTNGHFTFAGISITWANAELDLELPGFFTINVGKFAFEMGDIDQGKPGIYLTRYDLGEPVHLATLWSV